MSTPAALAATASELFGEGPFLLRTLQHWRPYICPFEKLIEQVPPGSSVLDVACGGGLLLGLLRRSGRIERGTGFDASAPAIDLAQRMARGIGGDGLVFERRDVGDAWPEGPFDVVTVVDLLHHVDPAAQATVIRTAADRVRSGGRLLYKDMCRRPRWRALANRAHDLVLARQWIHEVPIESVETWAHEAGLRTVHAARYDRWWYGHELRVFERT